MPTARALGASALTTRVARAARGWSVAVFATVTAAVSHGLAGGTFPGAFGIVASIILAGAASSLLTARKQSPWRLAIAVGLTQVLYHAVFSGMGDPTAPVVTHQSLHQHGAVALPEVLSVHGHSGSMWLAHVVAGVLTLLVLINAESALWGFAGTIALALSRLLSLNRPLAPQTAAPAVVGASPAGVTPLLVVLSSMRYRGPPVAPQAA